MSSLALRRHPFALCSVFQTVQAFVTILDIPLSGPGPQCFWCLVFCEVASSIILHHLMARSSAFLLPGRLVILFFSLYSFIERDEIAKHFYLAAHNSTPDVFLPTVIELKEFELFCLLA